MDLIRKYDRTRGSRDVIGLRVPVLALDEQSVTLVWDKPENMEGVADYAVFQDGERIGTARENFARHADWASTCLLYTSRWVGVLKAAQAVGIDHGLKLTLGRFVQPLLNFKAQ